MNIDFTTTGQKPEVTLYKNPKYLPEYTENLAIAGGPYTLTPRNMGFREGYFDIQLDVDTIMGCNYLKIDRGQTPLYAYIDRVDHLSGDKLHRIHYRVDPLRTYKNKLDLGNQFIVRSSTPTDLYDEMLGSTEPINEVDFQEYPLGNSTKRILVVQVRRNDAMEVSATPVQPSPYHFFFRSYNVADWTSDSAIMGLMTMLNSDAEPENIVTIYSVPYFNMAGGESTELPVKSGGSTTMIEGWTTITSNNATPMSDRITLTQNISVPEGLTRIDHKALLVIPEAGVMDIPDEAMYATDLRLRQDVDIFSGSSNYMLESHDGTRRYHVSARGSAVNNIPIVSDPTQTYISQNQSSLATSLLGDVATVGMGAMAIKTGAGAPMGGMMMARGVAGALGTAGNVKDAARHPHNPSAFLGSALAGKFSQRFWVVVYYQRVDNEELVHNEIGYPRNIMEPLTFPSAPEGFVQTQGCNLKSDGTVPQWAITELNNLFDRGIKVV